MFRMLLVEDDESTVEMLRMLLELHFNPANNAEHAPQIDATATVAEATALIEHAARPYHAVILDFKLPAHPGANPEVDESICRLLRRNMHTAIVGHITSHPNDIFVQEHLQHYHVENVDRCDSFALSKSDNDYTAKLTRNFKTALYGQRVEARMNRLFATSRGVTDFTHDLGELCCDIVTFWRDLDSPLQERIKQHFYVDETTQPIGLSLV